MKTTVYKALGFLLCLIASAIIGFIIGADRGYDTGYRMAIKDVKDGLLEGYRAKYTFSLSGMDELLFVPWAKSKRPRFSIAGAGDEGHRRVR